MRLLTDNDVVPLPMFDSDFSATELNETAQGIRALQQVVVELRNEVTQLQNDLAAATAAKAPAGNKATSTKTAPKAASK